MKCFEVLVAICVSCFSLTSCGPKLADEKLADEKGRLAEVSFEKVALPRGILLRASCVKTDTAPTGTGDIAALPEDGSGSEASSLAACPEGWIGVWEGKLKVISAEFGSVYSLAPDMLEARKHLIRPGTETYLRLPIDRHQQRLHTYMRPVSFTGNPLNNISSDTDPFQFICFSELESLQQQRIHNRLPIELSLRERLEYIEKLSDRLSKVKRENASQAAIIDLEDQMVEQNKLLVDLMAASKGLKYLAEGKEIPNCKDWYKHPGATVSLQLNGGELQANKSASSGVSLRNQLCRLSNDTYEFDAIIKLATSNGGRRTVDVISETVMKLKEVGPGTIDAHIARLIFNRDGQCEEKVILNGTMYKLPGLFFDQLSPEVQQKVVERQRLDRERLLKEREERLKQLGH